MNSNGRRPEFLGENEVVLRCKDMSGVIEYDGREPVIFRRRCKNQQCCPRREGHMATHRFCITKGGCHDDEGRFFGVGEYVTQYVPDKDLSEILREEHGPNAFGNSRRASV